MKFKHSYKDNGLLLYTKYPRSTPSPSQYLLKIKENQSEEWGQKL